MSLPTSVDVPISLTTRRYLQEGLADASFTKLPFVFACGYGDGMMPDNGAGKGVC